MNEVSPEYLEMRIKDLTVQLEEKDEDLVG